MALREHTRAACGAARNGRHGRPKPFGGRLRLPTIRFSGAAMAMSTVVGISLATTWLLNEQQQVGRRPDISVGASPPVPKPDGTAPAGVTAEVPTAGPTPSPTTAPPRPALAGGATALPGAHASGGTGGRPVARPTGTPSTSTGPTAPAVAAAPPSTPPAPDASVPPPTPGTGPRPVSPAPTPPTPSPTVTPTPTPDTALIGVAFTDFLGRSGTRHTVELTVDEPTTALQVEFRLRRPDALPGTVPATDLPGAIVTVSLERDTLVYRFTTRPGQDVLPDTYVFTVTGAPSPADTAETWTASGFATEHPRAVATRGHFPQ